MKSKYIRVVSESECQCNMEQELATIKRPGVVERISKEEFEFRLKEIAKCKRDIKYFAEKYFKIINLDTGLSTIKLYPKQRDLLDFFTSNKRCIVLASRQSSKTTTYTIYMLWLTMFHPEKKVMLLANKADTALEIVGRIRMAYEYIPSFLKPGVSVWNKGEIVFSNRSAVKGFATASDAARGYSANVVVMDECAFVPNNIASKVFESIYPTISSSKKSQFIMVSTPNGADPKNLYYDIWQKANTKSAANVNGWKPFRFDWWDVPGRDEQWKMNTIATIGEQRFSQEFGNEFLSSSQMKKLIPDDITEKYRMKISELKLQDKAFAAGKEQLVMSEKQDKMYKFHMWHEFQPGHTYLASGDAAEGVGADSSVLYVWDVTDLSNIIMCCKFDSNQVSLVEFAFITAKILALYNNPYYICERNGVGSGYLDSLRITYHYPNIVAEGKNREYGVYSHVQIKGKACLWAREMMTTVGFGWTIYDKDLLNDFNNFVRKETKGVHIVYRGLPPAHDDHIMAWIWACYILQPEVVEQYYVCTKQFTSQLDKIYPQRLVPLYEYKYEDVKKIADDPMYQEFLEFKEEIRNKLSKAMALERAEDGKRDSFYQTPSDPYFGDTGPSWNDSNSHSDHFGDNVCLNPYNNRPSFAINIGGGFGR